MEIKKYTHSEVVAAAHKFYGDDLAADAFTSKYALRSVEGDLIEGSPEESYRRQARELARIESKYPNPVSEDEIYTAFINREISMQGSPFSGIGNDQQYQSLSNCFVIEGPQDSYGGIFRADEQQAQIMKRRGGVGHDLSGLRPRGFLTTNAARTSDGVTLFMERFSNTTREVAQEGRRGALMLTVSVHHPDIADFITIKQDRKKVTGANVSVRITDEFMQAVICDGFYEQRWPVEDTEPKFKRLVRAKEVWDLIISSAHKCAEPGVLFWDTIIRNSPADAYPGFKTRSTNPCLTGDTLVAVADGRGLVSIRELAESGDDVPVFSRGENGEVCVKRMRHPRLTGKCVPVFRVTIEGGHSFKATEGHKLVMSDGSVKQVCELSTGDSLHIAKQIDLKFSEAIPGLKVTTSQYYRWWTNTDKKAMKAEHRIIWEGVNESKIPPKHVIHHIDFDALNNSPSNLRCMSDSDHNALHTEDMMGDKNPMRRAKTEWSEEKWKKYRENMSKSQIGLLNGNAYSDCGNQDLITHIAKLTIELGHRISKNEWVEYAEKNGIPRFLNGYRTDDTSMHELFKKVARECGIDDDLIDIDPRFAKTIAKARSAGYETRVTGSDLEIKRNCEECNTEFWNAFSTREVAFCGTTCSNNYLNRTTDVNERRTASINASASKRGDEKTFKQLDVYTKLKFELGRQPYLREWVDACSKSGVASRLGTKYGIKTWPEFVVKGNAHNHRVVSVEYVGLEDVYNGTVDNVHNFYMGGWKENDEKHKKDCTIYLNNLQCGELPLSPKDSCRLAITNTLAFVESPFEKTAQFNWEKFSAAARLTQRLMDDLVDLEIEAVERIIRKVESDTESPDIRERELELWRGIRDAAHGGRRTGAGVTGVGDTVAALGIRYGSNESIRFVDNLYRALCLASYGESVKMASERGAFPVWTQEADSRSPHIQKVLGELDEPTRALAMSTGRRNIACNTTAPVGTISLLTRTTSGIEPAFMLSYKRRRKVQAGDPNVRVDFVDETGDSWQEYTVYHPGFEKWMSVSGKSDPKRSPYAGATANEIDWTKSIELQAAAQKWIDHAISRTVNLPANTPVSVVDELYKTAWKQGCKGCTIYVDGSRSGVLVSVDENPCDTSSRPDELSEVHAAKRPETLQCTMSKVRISSTEEGKRSVDTWCVLVGTLNGKPYEVFAGLARDFKVSDGYEDLRIRKAKGKKDPRYELIGNGTVLVRDIVGKFDDPTGGAFTRAVSLSLRHGVPVQYVVEQLMKDTDSDMFSFAKAIARSLKQYIPNGTKSSEKTCDSCGSDKLVYQEGCATCTDCGGSKCG